MQVELGGAEEEKLGERGGTGRTKGEGPRRDEGMESARVRTLERELGLYRQAQRKWVAPMECSA